MRTQPGSDPVPARLFRVLPVFVSVALAAALTGCGSIKGEFNAMRDPEYNGRLERVLIVYYNEDDAARQLGRGFSDAFLGRMTSALGQRNVAVHIARPMQGAMDERAVVRLAVARFRPRQVMHFSLSRVALHSSASRVTARSGTQFSNSEAVTFSLRLINVSNDRIVWRGELTYPIIPDGGTVAEQLMERLVLERLL